MTLSKTSVEVSPSHRNLLETAVALLTNYKSDDYFAYERGETWHIGIGSHASLLVDSVGKSALEYTEGEQVSYPVQESLATIARKFIARHSNNGGKTFGYVGFNYAAHIRGQEYNPGEWPLLALIVPITEVTLHQDIITVAGYDEEKMKEICGVITSLKSSTNDESVHLQSIDTNCDADEYLSRVNRALSDISQGKYTKVIPSRVVNLKTKVDMLATMLQGRRSNTPARTFSLSHGGYQATGFSPELVMSVENRKVITEPLAGTRSHTGTDIEVERLKHDLLNDTKEIVEHIVSVKEAIEELDQLCSPDTVVVEDLMSVRVRGSVQHLGSRVVGHLSPEKDAWDALNVLFPSITASGIPKQAALEAIQDLEPRPRELYAGAVLMLEDNESFEATLVLRTIFQDQHRQWIQAGAGVISQSNAKRELEETCEKLSSVAPYVVSSAYQ